MSYNDDRQNNIFYTPQNFDFTDRNSEYNNKYNSDNNHNNQYNQDMQYWNTDTDGRQIPPYDSHQTQQSYGNYTGYDNRQPDNQSFYSNSYQTQSNSYNYQQNSYNSPYNSDYNNVQVDLYGHQAVEVPIERKMPQIGIIVSLCFAIPFILIFLLVLCQSIFNFDMELFEDLMPFMFGISFFIVPATMIVAPFAERNRLRNICTVLVTGKFVGYEQRRRIRRHRAYYVYAPKYEIFINNRYEIRTLNDFGSQNSLYETETSLFANPNGYEIMRSNRDLSNSGRRNVIFAIIFLIMILSIIFLPHY